MTDDDAPPGPITEFLEDVERALAVFAIVARAHEAERTPAQTRQRLDTLRAAVQNMLELLDDSRRLRDGTPARDGATFGALAEAIGSSAELRRLLDRLQADLAQLRRAAELAEQEMLNVPSGRQPERLVVDLVSSISRAYRRCLHRDPLEHRQEFSRLAVAVLREARIYRGDRQLRRIVASALADKKRAGAGDLLSSPARRAVL